MMNARNKEKLFYKLGLAGYVFHFSWRMKGFAPVASWITKRSLDKNDEWGVYIERGG